MSPSPSHPNLHPAGPRTLVPRRGAKAHSEQHVLQKESLCLDRPRTQTTGRAPGDKRARSPSVVHRGRASPSHRRALGSSRALAQASAGPTHTDCFTISEWILATPLTAWDPMTHRWAMLIRLQSPSSITDILRRRSTSPGNRAATCCRDRAVSRRAGGCSPQERPRAAAAQPDWAPGEGLPQPGGGGPARGLGGAEEVPCDVQEEMGMLSPLAQAGYNRSLPVGMATLSPKD